jgi:tetratricopeptide (TPR) repeat protein
MADCQGRWSQTDLAVKSYHLAEKLAVQTGQTKLESVADVNEAALEAKAGRLSEALPLYQHALHLDSAIGDDSAAASDWLSYGHFLDDAGFSPRLAYACLVKAQNITQSLHGLESPDATTDVRKSLEKRLGKASAAVRRDLEPALAEALTLRK